ncbi:hypothetical protein [Sphingomonas qomolangmaensis]|uniref:Uncharacterized protein n=1 Tax=Sphingomonas qomolangmaensis TaxID=2918765 RepID=A0ABY5LCU7_9SPHN|nr:hypothetical protein [Sphingomonas qomolangmaensis]UUL82531.1 hypothetical protein NMP03_15390 [Sphingomonas qomolangmaensis]
MDEDDHLRDFPALLSAIAEGRREATTGILEEAAAFLRVKTLLAAGSDQEGSLEPSLEHPGYLSRKIDGRPIFVPYNLAGVFPASDIVQDVMKIADRISLHPNDPVCISGSTTFLGKLEEIGDLDFCEYHLAGLNGLAEHAADVCEREDIPLIWLKFGDTPLKGPWAGRRDEIKKLVGGSDEVRMKFDFLSEGPRGLLPTTSVVIATNDDEVAARHSFAYQEAVVAGAGPVRNLVSPARFGEYVNWLRGEIRKLATPSSERNGYPAKALKRALSLLLIAGRENDTDEIIEELHGSELSSIVMQVRLDEIERMLNDLPEDVSDRFVDAFNELKGGFEHVLDEDIDEALDAARELALASLDIVEEEFRRYA